MAAAAPALPAIMSGVGAGATAAATAASVSPWAIGAMTTGLGLANSFASSIQAGSAARAQQEAMIAQTENQRQTLIRQHEIEQRRRQNLLERSQARARASFGARGLSTTDGSAGALLDGIQADADERESDARSMFDHRLGGLDAGLASSLQRIDAGRPDLLSTATRAAGQVGQLLRWGERMGGRSPGAMRKSPGDDSYWDYA